MLVCKAVILQSERYVVRRGEMKVRQNKIEEENRLITCPT